MFNQNTSDKPNFLGVKVFFKIFLNTQVIIMEYIHSTNPKIPIK